MSGRHAPDKVLPLSGSLVPRGDHIAGFLPIRGDHKPAGVAPKRFTAAAKSLQSCPTLCDPKTAAPPGSPVPGILRARTLEWVAISFSNA